MSTPFTILDPMPTALRDDIRDAIHELIASSGLGSGSVTYKRFGGTGSATYVPTTGVVTSPFTDATITVHSGPVSRKDVSLHSGKVAEGDRKFLVDVADLAGAPTTDDLIVWSSVTFAVVAVDVCVIGNHAIVYGRASGGA